MGERKILNENASSAPPGTSITFTDAPGSAVEVGYTAPPAKATPELLREATQLALTAVPKSAGAAALSEAITAQVLAWERQQGRRQRREAELGKLRVTLGAIIGGLLLAWRGSTPSLTFRSLAKADFTSGMVGHRQFKAGMEALTSLGLVGHHAGIRYNINPFGGAFVGRGEAARYWPTLRLLELAVAHGVTPGTVRADFDYVYPTKPPKVEELLVLKGLSTGRSRRCQSLRFDPEQDTAARLSSAVEAHNWLAAATPVTGCLPPRWQRTFTLCWSLHGRWYAVGSDGNYQRLPERERLRMTIAGEPVAEVDIRASHLSLLHGLFALAAPAGDPYAVDGLPREVVKAWVTRTLGKGTPVLRGWPEGTPQEVAEFRPRDVAEAVISRHPALLQPWRAVDDLAHLGDPKKLLTHRLMGIEADILSWVMSFLRESGQEQDQQGRAQSTPILSLPMHDGLIVPQSAVNRAVDGLRRAGMLFGKVSLSFKVSRPGTEPQVLDIY